MRWPMQAIRAPTRRQRVSRVIAALQFIATTFVIHAMVGRASSQLKMPRPDAYGKSRWRPARACCARRWRPGCGCPVRAETALAGPASASWSAVASATQVEWPGLLAEEKAEGWVLPCVAEALGDVVIDAPAALPLQG